VTRAAPRTPIPTDVWDYYVRMLEALRALGRQFAEVTTDPKSRFYRNDRGIFDEALEELRDELDHQVVLTLMASAEAMLRLDFAIRVDDPSKMPVHARFRILKARFDDKVPLEEILDVWKEVAGASHEAGKFKQLYKRRHWLGHGRYWDDKSGVQPRPKNTWVIINAFNAAVQTIAPDFPHPG
jgi:hypothetical protein